MTKMKTRKGTQMNKNTKKKTLTDWDWTTLVASWRYYEHGHTIVSSMFPHEIVKRFFTGSYDEESCRRIARQFVEIDHLHGPDDEIEGWVGEDEFGASERRAWRLFYFYLFAWHYRWFSKARVTIGGKSGRVEVFKADGKWYAKEGYEIFGAEISPYKVNEIEFVK